MVATRKKPGQSKTRLSAILFSLFFVALIATNCAVEISDDTYGAASACAPTADELVTFDAIEAAYFQNSGTLSGGATACGQCHLTTSGNTASLKFSILPGTDETTNRANFCSVRARQSRITSGFLIDGSHPGGVFPSDQIETLVTWANDLD